METKYLRDLLEQVKSGRMTLDDAMHELKRLPFEDLGYAKKEKVSLRSFFVRERALSRFRES